LLGKCQIIHHFMGRRKSIQLVCAKFDAWVLSFPLLKIQKNFSSRKQLPETL